MKRLLFLLLSLMLCFSFVACSDSTSDNVDVTIPSSIVDSEMDLDEYVASRGYNSASWNEDGSLNVNMSPSQHSEFLADRRTAMDNTFKEIMDEIADYVESIDYSDDLRDFTVTVEREGYDNTLLDMMPTLIQIQTMLYHSLANEEEGVTIHMVYSDTGEEFDTISYPNEE